MPTNPTSAAAAGDAALDPVFRDSSNDIVLRSSDGQSFPFRRLYLEAAGGVFEDMFAAGDVGGSSSVSGGLRKKDASGRAIVQLDDKGLALEHLLLFLHPRAINPRLRTIELLESVCKLADKYDLQALATAAVDHCSFLVGSSPAEMFGLALAHRSQAVFFCLAVKACLSRKPNLKPADIPYRIFKKVPRELLSFIILSYQPSSPENSLLLAIDALQNSPWEDLIPFKTPTVTDESLKGSAGVALDSTASEHAVFGSKFNDIVVRAHADGRELMYQSDILVGQSSVLREKVENAPPGRSNPQTKGLPVVVFDDVNGDELAMLLLFMHPEASNPILGSIEQLDRICTIANRFAVPSVIATAALQAVDFTQKSPLEVFAFAASYRLRALALLALRDFRISECQLKRLSGSLFGKVPVWVLWRWMKAEDDVNSSRGPYWDAKAREIQQDTTWFDEPAV